MSDIYEQHAKAFANVSAYVILKDGTRVATIAFKYPRDGAGRLWAYVHWLGVPMVRGKADGYGYDKRSAAVANAIPKMRMAHEYEDRVTQERLIEALRADDGQYWDNRLAKAGFTVLQAV